MSERVLDLSAGGYPEQTFVGKNTTVSDVAARVAELEAKNAKLRKCVEAADRLDEAAEGVYMKVHSGVEAPLMIAHHEYRAARAEVDKEKAPK